MRARLHETARCITPGCDWTAEGPDSDRAAHLHSTSEARGHIQHSTIASAHPTSQCRPDCPHPERGATS